MTAAGTFLGTGIRRVTPPADGYSQLTFSGSDQSFASYFEAGVTFGPGCISSTYAGNFNSTASHYDDEAGFGLVGATGRRRAAGKAVLA